jgi:hypothetical protein
MKDGSLHKMTEECKITTSPKQYLVLSQTFLVEQLRYSNIERFDLLINYGTLLHLDLSSATATHTPKI